MNISISKMNDELLAYNKNVEEYDECLNNINKLLCQSSCFWNDGKSNAFFKHLEKEKIDIQNIIINLNDVKKIIKFIIEQYGKIGDEISVDLGKKSVVDNYFNKILSNLNEIYLMYNDLDSPYNDNKRKVLETKNNLEGLRKKINVLFDYIEETEEKVRNKIEKLTLFYVKETDVNDFL